jgi:nucleotide-binding universal stress UspA family protein
LVAVVLGTAALIKCIADRNETLISLPGLRRDGMYKHILVAIDMNDEGGWRRPLLAGVEHARKFGAELTVLTVLREVEAMVRAQVAPLGYELFVADLENKLAACVREVNAHDLHPKLVVRHGASIYNEILVLAKEAGTDLIVVGSHRPAMKDYLLGTNAGRVVRHASCSVLVARE